MMPVILTQFLKILTPIILSLWISQTKTPRIPGSYRYYFFAALFFLALGALSWSFLT